MIEVLSDFATIDWQLAGLVCQVLWNYSTKLRNSSFTFGETQSHYLVALLTSYIGEYYY